MEERNIIDRIVKAVLDGDDALAERLRQSLSVYYEHNQGKDDCA